MLCLCLCLAAVLTSVFASASASAILRPPLFFLSCALSCRSASRDAQVGEQWGNWGSDHNAQGKVQRWARPRALHKDAWGTRGTRRKATEKDGAG